MDRRTEKHDVSPADRRGWLFRMNRGARTPWWEAPVGLRMAFAGLLVCGLAAQADDAAFVARVKADTEWLSSYATRQMGTPEHDQARDDLLARLRAIPNVNVWTQDFPVVVPVIESCTLEIPGGAMRGRHRIYPIWPDVVRLNTTPPEGLGGRCIYVGKGEVESLPARSLRGQIAVMEMSGYRNYRQAFNFGAAAVLLLGSDDDAASPTALRPLYKPRYYVPAGPLADALRAGTVSDARIVCRGGWQTVMARNLYAGVRPAGTNGVGTPYAMVAAYDAMSLTMGLAPGAESALDVAVMLNTLRDEAAHPTHPLLFGFVDAYHINQLGARVMMGMLGTTPLDRTRKDYDEVFKEDLAEYKAAAGELARFPTAAAGLAALHDRGACERIRRMFKDTLGPEQLALEKALGEVRLASRRLPSEDTPEIREKMQAAILGAGRLLGEHCAGELDPAARGVVEAAQGTAPAGFEALRQLASDLVPLCRKALTLRNSILATTVSASVRLSPEGTKVAEQAWGRMADRVRGQVTAQQQRAELFVPMDALRGELAAYFGTGGGQDAASGPGCSFVFGVDLSDCGVLVGPGYECQYLRSRQDVAARDFLKALQGAVKRGAIWTRDMPCRRVVNMESIGGRAGSAPNIGDRGLITSPCRGFLLPGVTWVTDEAPRQRVDTPQDCFKRLDWARIEPQLVATRRLVEWLTTTPDFKPEAKRGDEANASWRHCIGRVVDVSAGETVPRVPRPGFLATLVNTAGAPDRDGIRRHEFAWTGPDGIMMIPLLSGTLYDYWKGFDVVAYRLDAEGRIVEGLATRSSMVHTRLATSFNLGAAPGAEAPRAVTFECVELNGPDFFDARFLEPLTQGSLLDAARGGAPKKAQFALDSDGQMWGVVEPITRWQLVLRAGAVRTRMALLNADPEGRAKGLSLKQTFLRGFEVGTPLPSLPAHIAARDLYSLDDWRLKDFGAAGIKSAKIDAIHARTAELLAAADRADAADDGGTLQKEAVRALASEVRAYQAVKDMGEDVTRGAIFLLLMLVPFAVAMERLLFACVRIGRQVVAAVAIFAAMTALLWSFHPAFQISEQPLVIVMAFVILAMSVGVISMVLARFRVAVQEFRSSMAEGSGARMERGGLITSAIWLGIANMRKRKVRTLMTGSTVMLVTFALLCFSSARSYQDRKEFSLRNVTSQRPSVLVRRPSAGPMAMQAEPVVRGLLRDIPVQVGARVWRTGGLGDAEWRAHVLNPRTGTQASVMGVLGLPSVEDRLSGVDRVLTNWPAFAAAGGCYLAPDTAARLGVGVGDTVVYCGQELVVHGVFDPVRLEDEVHLLDGERITPYDYGRQPQDWVNRNSQEVVEDEVGNAQALEPASSTAEKYIPATDLMVVPAELLRRLGGSVRSLGIACDTVPVARQAADRLMETIVYPSYYTNPEGGVNVVVATPLVALPPRNLAIPLLIAALIIFTTMLNSVSERKGEIYVYTSLGLAPRHVGALFVAEALTYGLMGAVFGYVAGQGVASLLTHAGWMHGVTLNYSGTAVIHTMLLVQAVVVLSAIVPAIVAGRIAAPSTEMDWKVPEPVEGEIRDALPFTISPPSARGMVAFMREYLEAHREGVLGKFDADEIQWLPAQPGERVAGVEARIWLEPFDMGVRQRMRLDVLPPEDGVCGLRVSLKHETGAARTWWRLNRPFFFEMRRQLLGWRKLSPERALKYIEGMPDGTGATGPAGAAGVEPATMT